MTGFEGIFLFYAGAAAILWPFLLRDMPNIQKRVPEAYTQGKTQKTLLVIGVVNLGSPVLAILAGAVNGHYVVVLVGMGLAAAHVYYLRLFLREHFK